MGWLDLSKFGSGFKFKVFRSPYQSIADSRKYWREFCWHSKKTNSHAVLQLVRTMSNLSTLPKDKSQTGWRLVHPWWTNQWFELHWSNESDSEPDVVFWRKPKRLTPSFATSFILTSQQARIASLLSHLLASREALSSSVESYLSASLWAYYLTSLQAQH